MAQLWKLPVVYVIENNQYAMGTAVERSSATTEFSMRGSSFGIPGEQVDGMDVLAVRDAGARAAERVRSGAGPIILEMKTYRYRGHSMSDPAKYRTRDEVDAMRSTRDPIEHIRPLMESAGLTADRIKAVDDEVKSVVAEAVQFAQTSPEPGPARALHRRVPGGVSLRLAALTQSCAVALRGERCFTRDRRRDPCLDRHCRQGCAERLSSAAEFASATPTKRRYAPRTWPRRRSIRGAGTRQVPRRERSTELLLESLAHKKGAISRATASLTRAQRA
jgi:hypothetical protein